MGLDMYLEKETYIGAHYEHRNVKGTIELTSGPDDTPINIDVSRVSSIREQVAYWRKANQIHNWFTRDQEDDIQREVSGSELMDLVRDCKNVLEALKNSKVKEEQYVAGYSSGEPIYQTKKVYEDVDVAKAILPTTSGFFFGSTDYDEGYIYDLEETIRMLDGKIDEDAYYIYTASY